MSPVVFPRICHRSCPPQPTRSQIGQQISLQIVQVGSDSHLLKANLSSLAPVIADIVNVSIATGVFPSAFKKALVTPLLKKTTLDAYDVKNYRPVSNLCFVSKIVEKVVAVRFSKHLLDNDLYEQMQSAYRPNHSTETALLRVRNDLLCILDERKGAILVLLDLSAAFDTIDHTIMLTRVRERFGITATCLCMVLVVFGESKPPYSNARQNIRGTSSGVRRSARFRSRPAHVYLLHCSTR